MLGTCSLVVLLLTLVPQNFAKPLFIIPRPGLDSTSFRNNPAIRPLNMLDSDITLLRLANRNVPDLPESFSPLTEERYLLANGIRAMDGRGPLYY
ncbi:hypothetical protein KIN20_030249 [Parelaphostrongylus tenuis]|uniref:Uncharacterized protein n=1 Tax=Parelaphostrongylus tenuis TaxID=148309 RepID=A0AAD5R3G1_PARTN|nr:hypothetical protein KIN20_030249 [Parelaphostrongylus tenuis]